MAVRKKEELLETITKIIGDRTDDDSLTILEDVSDTLDELSKVNVEDWKTKYEENDKAWREKYKARFMKSEESIVEGDNPDNYDDDKDDDVKTTFDELFTKGE